MKRVASTLIAALPFAAVAADGSESEAGTTTYRLEPVIVGESLDGRGQETQSRDSVSGQQSRDYNPANAYDSLRLVPGVNFNQNGTRYGSPSRIRGSALWSTADAIEGLPPVRPAGNGTEDGGFNTGLGAIIPAVAIERINVAKGGLGVRYGGNVDGGVITTDLQQGGGDVSGEVVYDYSPIREHLLMADVGGETDTGRFDYYFAGKTLDGDYDEVTSRTGEKQLDQNLNSGLARLGFQPSQDTRLEVIGVSGHEEHDWRDLGETSNNRRHTTNQTNYLAFQAQHGADPGEWHWSTGYTLYDREAERYNVSTATMLRDRPQKTHTVFAELGQVVEFNNDIRWSPEVSVQHVDHEQREEAPGSEKEQNFTDSSVGWSNTLAVGERWTFTGGLRSARLDSDGGEDHITVYELGAARTFLSTGTRLHVSNSTNYYRNKGYVFFASGAFGGDDIPGGLPPAETETTELGIRQQLPLAAGGFVKAVVFDRETENAPNFGVFGAGSLTFDTTEARGVEFMADLGLSETLRAQLSYTHMETEIVNASASTNDRVGDTAVPAPEDTAGLGLSWDATDRLRLSSTANYDSGYRQVDESSNGATVTEADSFVRWNAVAEWRATDNFTVAVRGENLLDEKDLNFKQASSDGSTSGEVGETPGRFFALNLQYRY
ncbi:TonB-dependent receptor [Vreelandella utahensis]|uniref:TonB-dependent receptor n=1 Tax=Vreelandella halophila TaxID=86177 RepID=UPI000984B047|nr:TonB-dependent receptor plug domain-containing protein [Halomonas utahensis]